MGFKVTTAANGRPAFWVYGIIGQHILPIDVVDALKGIPAKQPIDVFINSPGGSFSDSIAIHSNLSRHKGGVDVLVEGTAASGASVIAQAGRSIRMATGSWMMIHEARAGVDEATANELRDLAGRIDQINDQLVQIYKPRWKGTEKDLRAAVAAESWFSDSDSVSIGLADEIDSAITVAACADLSTFCYKQIPEQLKAESRKFRTVEGGGDRLKQIREAA